MRMRDAGMGVPAVNEEVGASVRRFPGKTLTPRHACLPLRVSGSVVSSLPYNTIAWSSGLFALVCAPRMGMT